jgi:hypothetical protein
MARKGTASNLVSPLYLFYLLLCAQLQGGYASITAEGGNIAKGCFQSHIIPVVIR